MSVAVSAAACPAVLVIVMPGSGRTGVLDIPDPGGGGLAGELGEVAGLAAECALHAVGETGVSPVEHLAEEVGEQLDHLCRPVTERHLAVGSWVIPSFAGSIVVDVAPLCVPEDPIRNGGDPTLAPTVSAAPRAGWASYRASESRLAVCALRQVERRA
jgi:hypothetical protein